MIAFIETDAVNTFAKIINVLVKEKVTMISINMHLPTMDDVFIRLTGTSLRDELGEQKSDRGGMMMFKR